MICKVVNKKNRAFIVISIFLLCQFSFSQSSDWMSEDEINGLEKMDLTYNKPNKFNEVKGYEFFENNLGLIWIRPGRNQLRSKDDRIIVFSNINDISPIKLREGEIVVPAFDFLSSEEIERYLSGERYVREMKYMLLRLKGEELATNWEQYLNFYSKEESKNKFNADKAISYSIKLQPENYYKGKYNNLWVLFLQKKYKRFKTPKEFKEYKKLKEKEIESIWGLKEKTLEEVSALKETKGYRDFMESWEKNLNELNELTQSTGFVMMYCFYKDMPKRKLARYKKKVEKIFRYED